MNLKTITRTVGRTLNKNASKILLGFGIAGAFMAVGFAVEATPKAMILLEEKKKEVEAELEAAIHKGRSCGLTDHDLTELFEIVLEG